MKQHASAAKSRSAPAPADSGAAALAPPRYGVGMVDAVQRATKKVSAKAAPRLALAKEAIDYTKKIVPEAGNQVTALKAGRLAPFVRFKIMRNEQVPKPVSSKRPAKTSGSEVKKDDEAPAPPYWRYRTGDAKQLAENNPADDRRARALVIHGGQCSEYADVAYSYLRVTAKGQPIAKCSVIDGMDHNFVLIGNLATEDGDAEGDIVAADAWPVKATATLWEDHFSYVSPRSKIEQERRMVADGEDVATPLSAALELTESGNKALELVYSQEQADIFAGTQLQHHLAYDIQDSAGKGKLYDYLDSDDRPVGGAARETKIEAPKKETQTTKQAKPLLQAKASGGSALAPPYGIDFLDRAVHGEERILQRRFDST